MDLIFPAGVDLRCDVGAERRAFLSRLRRQQRADDPKLAEQLDFLFGTDFHRNGRHNPRRRFVDLVITAANVTSDTSPDATLIAGEALTGGQLVYKKAADGKLWRAGALAGGTAALAALYGMVLPSAVAAGQYCPVAKSGATITVAGAAYTIGMVLVVSPNNLGGVAPVADLVSTGYVTTIGVIKTATTIGLNFNITGVVHA